MHDKLHEIWKKGHNKAIQPRLKDFKHDVREANLPDNQLSNWAIGMVPFMEAGVNAAFAK